MRMQDTVKGMAGSRAKVSLPFRGNSLLDALNFGFSYIESEDHLVHYVAANPVVMKRIIAEIPDATIDPTSESIGQLWTARLLVMPRLTDRKLIFSNNTFSAVLDIDLNPNQE